MLDNIHYRVINQAGSQGIFSSYSIESMLAEKVSFLVPTILSDAELSVLISVYGRCEQPVAHSSIHPLPIQESFFCHQ